MSLAVVHHPDYRAPVPPGHRFPMPKYGYLRQYLLERGLLVEDHRHRPEPVPPETAALAHDPGYVARAFSLELRGEEVRRIGLPQTARVILRSRLAVAGTLLAAKVALRRGLACNAAGGSHHAGPEGGAGYCVMNDVSVAIRGLHAERPGLRALVIDCDVHQGDGTALTFAADRRVTTFSIHAERNFPFEKARSDLDIGLPDGTGDEGYLRALRRGLSALGAAGPFDLIFYNAGVDVHADDRLGRLGLSDAGIRARDAAVLGWARPLAPVVGVLGGGYGDDPSAIAARHLILFEEAAKLA